MVRICKGVLLDLDKLGKSRLVNNITAGFLTIVILLVMIIPAKAVIIDLMSDKTSYKKDDIITFTVSVDIENNERIPIQNLTLRVSNSSDTSQLIKQCAFSASGAKMSGCENILEITPINVQGYGYGYSFGYGYGYGSSYGYGYANQTFGYGYGYGYSAGYAGLSGELAYNITWNITADNVSDGNYSYDLWAYADDGNGNSRIYSDSSLSSFEYDGTLPSITIQRIIATNNTNPILNVTTSENTNCSYKNSTEEFALMNTTGATAHTQQLSLYPGDFSYTIQCADSAGNTANDSISFSIISSDATASETFNTTFETTANQSSSFNTTSGLELNILADVSTNASITVAQFSSNPENVTTGFAAAALGKYFTITASDILKDNLGWIYLKINYSDSDISSNNIDETTLKIYYYNSTLGRWVVESDTGVNTTANYVWANVTHLSTFAAGGSQAVSAAAASSSSSGRTRPAVIEPVPPAPPVPPIPPSPEKPTAPPAPGPGPLFDFSMNILNDMKKAFAGEYLGVEFTLINVGEPGIIPVKLSYRITNSAGNEITTGRFDLTVEAEKSFVEKIIIPEYLASGRYKIASRIEYNSKFASAEDYFEIVEPKPELVALYAGIAILAILLIVAGAFFYVRYDQKIKDYYKKFRFRRK